MFMDDVKNRLAGRVQLTTDGLKAYLVAVEGAFGADVDFAQLVKLYGEPKTASPERKYSPSECTGIRCYARGGTPRPEAHFNVSRRTPKFDNADAHAAVYSPDQRILEEV